jgi:hypothetical protein
MDNKVNKKFLETYKIFLPVRVLKRIFILTQDDINGEWRKKKSIIVSLVILSFFFVVFFFLFFSCHGLCPLACSNSELTLNPVDV